MAARPPPKSAEQHQRDCRIRIAEDVAFLSNAGNAQTPGDFKLQRQLLKAGQGAAAFNKAALVEQRYSYAVPEQAYRHLALLTALNDYYRNGGWVARGAAQAGAAAATRDVLLPLAGHQQGCPRLADSFPLVCMALQAVWPLLCVRAAAGPVPY